MSNIAASAAIRARLAHGFQVLASPLPAPAPLPMSIGDALIAFIEQSSKFLKPVYPGDTLYPILESPR